MKKLCFLTVIMTASCAGGPTSTATTDEKCTSSSQCEKGEICTIDGVCIPTGSTDAGSCSVASISGLYTITCPNGSTVSWQDGMEGPAGADGTNGIDGKNGTDGTNGIDGKDGKSCSVVNNGDGTATMFCPDGSTVTWALGSILPSTCIEGTVCAAPATYCSGDFVVTDSYLCLNGKCVVGNNTVNAQCVDGCSAGACLPPVTQPPVCVSDACTTRYLDPTSTVCVTEFKPAGTTCDDANATTTIDACNGAGTCVGSNVVNPPVSSTLTLTIKCPGGCQPHVWHDDKVNGNGTFKGEIPDTWTNNPNQSNTTHVYTVQKYEVCNQIDKYDLGGNIVGKFLGFEMAVRDLDNLNGGSVYKWYGENGSWSLDDVEISINGTVVPNTFLHRPANTTPAGTKEFWGGTPNKGVPLTDAVCVGG